MRFTARKPSKQLYLVTVTLAVKRGGIRGRMHMRLCRGYASQYYGGHGQGQEGYYTLYRTVKGADKKYSGIAKEAP